MKYFLDLRSLLSFLKLNNIADKNNKTDQSLSQEDIHKISLSLPGIILKLQCKDQIFTFDYVSDKIQELTGNTANKIIQNSDLFFKAIHPKDFHTVKNHFRKSYHELLPVHIRFGFLRDHNLVKEVELHAVPVQKEGKVIWHGNIIEILEDQRQDNFTLYKNALEHISEGVIITSAENDHPIIYVNNQFLKETGYTREEVLGKNPRFLQGEKTDRKVLETVRQALNRKEVFRGEIINYRKDKSYFLNLMTINPVLNEQNEVTHFVGLQSNISYRIKVEEALKESIERYNLAVKATNDVIWDWDFLENKIVWPSSDGKIFDYNLIELNNDPSWKFDHIHPEDKPGVYKGLYNSLKEKKNYWHDEYRFQKSNGEYLYILDRAFIVYDKKDNPVRMIGAKQDLTEHKKMLDLQTNLAKELSHRNKDLQQFSYIVSHNLRSSIARIKGLSTLLKYPEHQVSDQTNQILSHISNMAENLDETIKDLSQILDVRSDYKEHKEVVEIENVFEKVKIVLQDQIDTINAEITVNFKKAPTLITLKSYLFSIMLNLISNALKYRSLSRKLKIEISTYKMDTYVVLEVKDNGLGINLNMQKDKIFGLYKRFHPQIEGKGLGLYLVKTQAESLGGKVEVESIEDEGSIFKIFFKSTF